jgi:hypothetical protein
MVIAAAPTSPLVRYLGITGFNEMNPNFDPTVLGCFMEAYYGGRSGVRIRHMIVEVIYCDFKSQYPTVNALMNLQELLIAGQVGVHRDRKEAFQFLQTVTLQDLQKRDTWPKLRGVALVEPDDDILPYRTHYGENEDGSLSVNIGINRVISACPAWWTFADIIASKLLTGRTPKIIKTLELFPIGRQDVNAIELFGETTIDLSKDDFFATLIDARIAVEMELRDIATPEDRKPFLKSFQGGLKNTANGTSYGALNEFVVDDHLAEVPTMVYYGGASAKVKARLHSIGEDGGVEISDYKAEKPGKYFAPFGLLIPAAGRLLLAIGERLAADRGLVSAFDDTDSMAFCDPHKLYSREDFQAKVQEITAWFQPLNPYKHAVPLFAFEKINYGLADHATGKTTDTLEPLYCLAVSAKRYCLFNRGKDGAPIIRKASAHGLGDVSLPAEYQAKYEHAAAPFIKNKDDSFVTDKNGTHVRNHRQLVAGSAGALFLDMWYQAILGLDARCNIDDIDKTICTWPELAAPQHSQTSLSTRDTWLKYQNLPNRRAFMFFETLPAPKIKFTADNSDKLMFAELKEAEASSLYTNFSNPFTVDLNQLFRRDTNELIKPFLDDGMELTTIADRGERPSGCLGDLLFGPTTAQHVRFHFGRLGVHRVKQDFRSQSAQGLAGNRHDFAKARKRVGV